MASSPLLSVFLSILFLLFAIFWVAAEEAFSRIHAVRPEDLSEKALKRYQRVLPLLEKPESVSSFLRFWGFVTQLAQTALVTYLAFTFSSGIWPFVIIVCNSIIVFVVAEALPRTVAILHSAAVLLACAGFVSLFFRFLPMRFLSDQLITLTNSIVPGQGLRQGPFRTPEELLALADAAVEDEVLEQRERDLIESVIEFGDTIVREVMVPRTDMTTVPTVLSCEEVMEVASEMGFSRLPVVGENVDDVLGLVYVKDLIRAELDEQTEKPLEELLRPSRFVPETKKVADLLKEMQKEKFHMAVAVDEYGGIAGLVTLEDLIEEILGEIVDEYDTEEPLVERQRDGSLRVDARISIDELNHLANMSLPEGAWDTVGGLVFDQFGKVPAAGDSCEVPGYLLRVERVQGRRVSRVRVCVLVEEGVADGE